MAGVQTTGEGLALLFVFSAHMRIRFIFAECRLDKLYEDFRKVPSFQCLFSLSLFTMPGSIKATFSDHFVVS